MFKKKKTEDEEILDAGTDPTTVDEETDTVETPDSVTEQTSKKNKKEKNAGEQTQANLWKIWAQRTLLICLCFVYTEVVLHLFLFKSMDWKIIFPIFFSLFIAGIFAFFASLMPKIPRRIFIIAVVAVPVIFSEVQLVYHSIFGTLMPLNLAKMGGAVVTNFRDQTFYAIGHNIIQIIVLFVPVIALAVLAILFRKNGRTRLGWAQKLTTLALPFIFALLFFGLLFFTRNMPRSMWKVFNDPNTSTDKSYKNLGMWATTVQETRFMLFGDGGEGSKIRPVAESAKKKDDIDYTSKDFNMIDELDFKTLSGSLDGNSDLTKEQKTDLKEIDAYMDVVAPTGKNKYTGILKGYNVVTFCAESFSPLFISEELTPTLYKMTHEGFVFENFYGTFPSVTTNGEYTMCMGLYPDLSRTKTNSSFDVSIKNYLPFCLGTALREKGYVTYAYHNYLGSFYNRYLTHPNMGYDCKFVEDGLNMEVNWPASDREMIDISMDDYISDQPFHAYYMTFSGHYTYDFNKNPMSRAHFDEVKDLPYSDTVKAFIACNLEVEYALRDLEARLEEEGIADRTLIVLTNDHYPYGLSEEDYNELAGQKIDTVFERFHNSFICYVPGIETVHVTEYCSTADILPTVLNLLGVDYDSRLLMGVDVMAPDVEHIAVLSDGSFLTKDFRYDATADVVYPAVEGGKVDEGHLEDVTKIVQNRFNLSKRILYSNYYSHVFGGKQPVNPVPDSELGVVFEDIDDVFGQAAATFMCTKGFVDPKDTTTFGGEADATFGEMLDILYRIAGSPEPAGEFPDWYDCGEDFDKDSKWYNAVCWAAENGIIGYWDTLVAPDEPVPTQMMLRTIYRSCTVFGVDNHIHDSEVHMIDEAKAENPYIDRETLEAIHFLFYSRVFTGYTGSISEVWAAQNETMNRLRMTNVMFKFYNYHVSKVWRTEGSGSAE